MTWCVQVPLPFHQSHTVHDTFLLLLTWHGEGQENLSASALHSVHTQPYYLWNEALLQHRAFRCASHALLYSLPKAAVSWNSSRCTHSAPKDRTGTCWQRSRHCAHEVLQALPQQQPTKHVYFKFVWLSCQPWAEGISVWKTETARSQSKCPNSDRITWYSHSNHH